jgi:hypothetical protein
LAGPSEITRGGTTHMYYREVSIEFAASLTSKVWVVR